MKRNFALFAFIIGLAACSGPSNKEVLAMDPDTFMAKAPANRFVKTEVVRVARSTAMVEKSFQNAARSCLKQQFSEIDTLGMGHVITRHVPKVYRKGGSVFLEIRQFNNLSETRLFIAKAAPSSSGSVVTMVGPKFAHNVIFKHVGGYAQGRGGCFKYPAEPSLFGL